MRILVSSRGNFETKPISTTTGQMRVSIRGGGHDIDSGTSMWIEAEEHCS